MITRGYRLALLTLTAAALSVALAMPAAADQAMVGPECRPSVVAAVLAALAHNGTPVIPGQQVQYLQVSQRADGTYYVEPCVVTVPE